MPGFFMCGTSMVQVIYGQIQKREIRTHFSALRFIKNRMQLDQMRSKFEAIEHIQAFAVSPLWCLRGAQPTNTT
jgi:hypothetical protein